LALLLLLLLLLLKNNSFPTVVFRMLQSALRPDVPLNVERQQVIELPLP